MGMFGLRGVLRLAVVVLAAVFVLLSSAPSSPSRVLAVEPGVNCSSYAGGVCEIEVGDIWFCEPLYQDAADPGCPTSIQAGDTVRWDYPASAQLVHTTTECGADCDAPTATPVWDSDILEPGDSFEFTFDTPGAYLYYCTFHPTTQRGLIRVLEPEPAGPAGDVNCDESANSIDATLILQLDAGLIDSLSCQQNADVNGDGNSNSIDATLILQFDAGLIDSL